VKQNSENTKSARLEARISTELHEQVKMIAKKQHRSVSDFLITALRQAIIQAAKEDEIIELSMQDQEQLANILINPPANNKAVINGIKNYKKMINNGYSTN